MEQIFADIVADPILVFLMAASVLVVVAVYGSNAFHGMRTSRRFRRIVGDDVDVAIEEISAFNEKADDNIENFLQRILPSVQETQRRMSSAGVRLSVRIYLLGVVFLALFLNLFLKVPGLPSSIAPVANPVVIAFCLHLVNEYGILHILRSRHRARMLKQIPDAIDHIVRSLNVGQSLETAIRASVSALQSPLADEFQMLSRLLDAGSSMLEAMNYIAVEIDLPEFDFFVAAAGAQMESGGNLGKVLENLVEMIRGREQLQDKVSSLSAEGKLSAWVLCSLPILFVLGMRFTHPDFIEPLFTTDLGNMVLGAVGAAVVIGGFISWRMTQIRV